MPAATEIFKECFMPNWGISMLPSHNKIVSCSTPETSLPKISAILSRSILEKFSSEMLSATCSTANIL